MSKSWFNIRNEAGEDSAKISIFDEIGMWGVTAKDFAAALAGIPKERNITCSVNSPGGDLFQAFAIYNLLNGRRDKVTCRVEGVAASSASIIALAGCKTVMPKNSFLMVHNPSGGTYGESGDLEKYAELLKKCEDQIANIYARETGCTADECKKMMDETTWLDADQAKEKGFCDEVEEAITVTAKFDLRRFDKVPKNLADAEGGKPATDSKTKSMKLIIAALVAAGLAVPENATEEQIAAHVKTLAGERDTLQNSITEERKKRVTARVKSAIDAKKIKAEREASLVALGVANEANLDFLDDIETPKADGSTTPPAAGARRGAPPAPANPGTDTDTTEQKIDNLQAELKKEKDPLKVANLARQLRDLRGHKGLFGDDKD